MIFRSSDRPPEGISRREWRRRNLQTTPPASTADADPAPVPVAPEPAPQSTAPDVDDNRPTILTVCTGNICRSPMAEVLLRARLEPLGVRVHSAGTHALVDHTMTEPAQEIAVELGAGPDAAAGHRARYLVEPMLKDADLVLTMAREHRSHSVQLMPSALKRTFTLREFARLASTLSTEAARAAADAAGDDPRERLRAAALAVTEQRGLTPAAPDEDDIIDPYRRSRETYELSASQLAPGIDDVERIVRAALVR
ncbi:arsenate reductase/protein-tyrosine-phosphatase family protein [Microbacterium sp. KHB019]|uniref:arsenate reductase/protein-tyrosine-phosphatase family protein n=1 Tax=Microbacterium sp. KHB019 TaxID=3129770 RepID=UPI0030799629